MARPSAIERTRRVLALVPWIAGRDGPTIGEVCARFEITEAQLMKDLDVVFLVGVPPYTPDALIEVDIADGRVWIRYADYFAKPLRLTHAEGLALLASATAVRGVPGFDASGPLARGLEKLAGALGVDPEDDLRIELGEGGGQVLPALSEAVSRHRRVRLDYFSHSRNAMTARAVDPYRLFASGGAWYLMGHCHEAGGARLFRADRVATVEETGEVFRPPSELPPPSVFDPDPDDPRVTLDLPPEAAWVVDHYPVERVERGSDGRLQVRLAVASESFLARLLLRLGPEARVIAGPESLAGAGPRHARRVLARYGIAGQEP